MAVYQNQADTAKRLPAGPDRPEESGQRSHAVVLSRWDNKGESVEMMANATDNQHAGQELRRDKRFQVSQAAIITQPGHTEIACEIRHFRQGGLLLQFTN